MHFTLSDLVIDIAQNAVESAADLVELDIAETAAEFRFTVRDNGKGMDQDELKQAMDPFVTDGVKHPHRKVGLGIPFLIQTAVQSGGGWDIRSEKNLGTTVTAWFDRGNVDTPPVGDLSGMFRTILLFQCSGDILVRRFCDDGKRSIHYEVRKSGLLDALGDLEDAGSLALLQKYLKSIEEDDERFEASS